MFSAKTRNVEGILVSGVANSEVQLHRGTPVDCVRVIDISNVTTYLYFGQGQQGPARTVLAG